MSDTKRLPIISFYESEVLSFSLDFFAVVIFLYDILNSSTWIKNFADRTIVVQSINDKCNIFAEITVDVPFSLKKEKMLSLLMI